MVEFEDWPEIKLNKLGEEVEHHLLHKRYCFIQDLNGNAKVYFQYKAQMVEFFKEVMKVQAGRQTKDEASETLRQQFVHAMRSGSTLAICLSDLEISIKDYVNEAIFPLSKILDFESAREPDSYVNFVKPEEKHGFDGKVNGVFQMQKSFTIVFVTTN